MLKKLSRLTIVALSTTVLSHAVQAQSLLGLEGASSDSSTPGEVVDTWAPEGYAPNHIPKCINGGRSIFAGTAVGKGDGESRTLSIAADKAEVRAKLDVHDQLGTLHDQCVAVPGMWRVDFVSPLLRYSPAYCEFVFDGDKRYECFQEAAQSYNCCTIQAPIPADAPVAILAP
jgi:hypothetical protein